MKEPACRPTNSMHLHPPCNPPPPMSGRSPQGGGEGVRSPTDGRPQPQCNRKKIFLRRLVFSMPFGPSDGTPPGGGGGGQGLASIFIPEGGWGGPSPLDPLPPSPPSPLSSSAPENLGFGNLF